MSLIPTQSQRPESAGASRQDASSSSTALPTDATEDFLVKPPVLQLPKDCSVRGMGEKFSTNLFTGAATLSIPIFVPMGRSGFQPDLTLTYSSGAGISIFGMGWIMALPSITRKTEHELPQYQDSINSDTFVLSGGEDLVPRTDQDAIINGAYDEDGNRYTVSRYRPRVEQSFTLVEKWTRSDGDVHWRTITNNNITSIYGRMVAGKDVNTRIADPQHASHIFTWLICEMRDGRGNLIRFEYKPEDEAGKAVNPSDSLSDRGNVHLKSVLYGNREPDIYGDKPTANHHWNFRVVLDFGEHDPLVPAPLETRTWNYRLDTWANYRSGFCLRTRRLVSRVLCFSHLPAFTDAAGVTHAAVEGGTPYLVASTNFTFTPYSNTEPYTLIQSIAQHRYIRKPDGSYRHEQFPPLEFEYSIPHIKQGLDSLAPASFRNFPEGLANNRYQLIDLDGVGVTGIVYEQGEHWYFKEGLSEAGFGESHVLPVKPSTGNIQTQRLQDLTGEGLLSLVSVENSLPGFYERSDDGGWKNFKHFESLPNVDWIDSALQLIDLNQDGFQDILIAGEKNLIWYPSLGKKGFGEPRFCPKPEEGGKIATMFFADLRNSWFLADVSGDGMPDIVRVTPGSVVYFPNLGFSKFGRARFIDNPPHFDEREKFDPRKVVMADLNGDGCADLLYTGDECAFWINQSANRFGPKNVIAGFPKGTERTRIQLVDLKSTGTLCLAWSSSLPADEKCPLKYVDLMQSHVKRWSSSTRSYVQEKKVTKPFLMTGFENGLGGRTEIDYLPSTKYYLDDRAAGKPWQTRLPMPVQVVSTSRVIDLVTSSVYESRYRYHHGYFNREREFCGFGLVEQFDSSHFSHQGLDQATVHIKTWYHTGAWISAGRLEDYYRSNEYYQEDSGAWYLADTIFDRVIRPDEYHEAARALKGSVLRQETYAIELDPATGLRTARSMHPYTTSERSYRILRLQDKGTNRFGCFTLQPLESISYSYEQDTQLEKDPRIGHEINLRFDQFNNVLEKATVSYPRRTAFQLPAYNEEQNKLRVVYNRSGFGSHISLPSDYTTMGRRPGYCHSILYEQQQWEYCNHPYNGGALTSSDFPGPDTLPSIEFFERAGNGRSRRLVSHVRHFFYDDRGRPLQLSRLGFLALPFESHQLAFTQTMLEHALGAHYFTALRAELSSQSAGGYFRDGIGYWRTSGSSQFDVANFYHATDFLDPFGNKTTVERYWHNIVPTRVKDAAGNVTDVTGIDPYTLQPKQIKDANDNVDEVIFDVLGQPVGSARIGRQYHKASNTFKVHGFTLANFNPFLTLATDATQPAGEIDDLINNDPLSVKVINYLQETGSRSFVDYWRFKREGKPIAVLTATREDFATDRPLTTLTQIRTSITYQDGLGRTLVSKLHVEDGPAIAIDNNGLAREVDTSTNPALSRWLSSGFSIYNNKGNKVQQFENYYVASHKWLGVNEQKCGVSNFLYYDPLDRVEKVKLADGTLTRTAYGTWLQSDFDQNDAVLDPECRWYQTSGSPNPADPSFGQSPNQILRAAWLAAQHANTPKRTAFDNLGRAFDVLESRTLGVNLSTRSELDVSGNARSVTNPMGYRVIESEFSFLREPLRTHSFDSGDRRGVSDGAGNPFVSWDGKGTRIRSRYDSMHRPLSTLITEAARAEKCIFYTVYGDRPGIGSANDRNLRGTAAVVLHEGGATESVALDIYGRPLSTQMQVSNVSGRQYDPTNPQIDILANWSLADGTDPTSAASIAAIRGIMANSLEPEIYRTEISYNAIGEALLSHYSYFNSQTPHLVKPVGTQENTFNSRGRLATVNHIDFQGTRTNVVTTILYNEKGQRRSIVFGNKVVTTYQYNRENFRLTRLTSKRDNQTLQDMTYWYDAVGNVTALDDAAQQNIFFTNREVSALSTYEYDALYRLTFASGREHLGLVAGTATTTNPARAPRPFDNMRGGLPQPGDGNAVGRYHERFTYDDAGNVTLLQHFPENQIVSVWSREYRYEERSSINSSQFSNRLTYTIAEGQRDDYAHDANGNMVGMPHLTVSSWNATDQLQATSRQQVNTGVPITTYYQYDSSKQRVRKITFSEETDRTKVPIATEMTVYAGPFELHRRLTPTSLERITFHVMDENGRIALVETKTAGNDPLDGPLNTPMIRYQHADHLGSSSLELDANGIVISYELFYAWGETSYQAVDTSIKRAAKRYRYSGKERDSKESGLYYYGARYLLPWLGRWASCDTLPTLISPYAFVDNRPIIMVDEFGETAESADEESERIMKAEDDPTVYTPDDFTRMYHQIWRREDAVMDAQVRLAELEARSMGLEQQEKELKQTIAQAQLKIEEGKSDVSLGVGFGIIGVVALVLDWPLAVGVLLGVGSLSADTLIGPESFDSKDVAAEGVGVAGNKLEKEAASTALKRVGKLLGPAAGVINTTWDYVDWQDAEALLQLSNDLLFVNQLYQNDLKHQLWSAKSELKTATEWLEMDIDDLEHAKLVTVMRWRREGANMRDYPSYIFNTRPRRDD